MTGNRDPFALIGAPVARLTKVDSCGRPVYGDRARLITEGFISVTASAQVDEGNAVEIPNANGKIVARRRAKPKHNGYTVEVEMVGVQPDLAEFLAAAGLVLDGKGDVAGIDVDTDTDPSTANVALEVWSETGDGEGCEDTAGTGNWGYSIFPLLSGGTVGDISYQNDAINLTISNAASKKGHQWGQGPYMVDLDSGGDPVQLATIPSGVALRAVRVGLEPPVPSEGAIPLDDPAAPAATTAVTGTPGHFTPTGAFRPETLADMAGITASPTTAWTTGQGVMLQDGTFAHWSGTAWVAGKA